MSASRASVKRYISDADCGVGDLFGEPELPAGFRYVPDVLSPKEEKDLVQQFEKLPLKPFEFHGYQGNRRICDRVCARRRNWLASRPTSL
jgi:hypothetical protein